MAKMLKALRTGDATPFTQPNAAPSVPSPTPDVLPLNLDDAPVSLLVEKEVEEAFPFIEVGSNRQVEGSPDVMAIPVLRGGRSEQAKSEEPASKQQEADGDQDQSGPIVFEPWDDACGQEMSSALVVHHEPDSLATQRYHEIVDRFVERYTSARVLLFPTWTDSRAAVTVLNLALAACYKHGKKVAVVDLHLSQPELASYLGLPNAPGLADVLAGRLALQQAFRASSVENFYALPTGHLESDEELQWSGDVLPWITSWLQSQFDLSFLYAPQLSTEGHQGALASLCDAVFPILGQADQSNLDISKQLRTMQQGGACIAGLLYARAHVSAGV
ncbi:MAG: hypothetical protein ACFCD0_02960 [Gemmataceae bacterium]